MSDQEAREARIQNAVRTLAEVAGGDALEEFDQQLERLVRDVKRTLNGGSITLKVGLKPADKHSPQCLREDYEVKLSRPKENRRGTFVYPHSDDTLHTDIEGQMRLNLGDGPSERPLPERDPVADQKQMAARDVVADEDDEEGAA